MIIQSDPGLRPGSLCIGTEKIWKIACMYIHLCCETGTSNTKYQIQERSA